MRDSWMEGIEARALAAGGKVTKVRRDILAPAPSRHDPIAACSDRRGRHTLVIDGWCPPALNKVMRGRMRTRIKIGRETHDLIAAEAARQRVPVATEGRRVHLFVTYPKGAPNPDPDALWKCLLDALKGCGMLIDDSYQFVELAPPVYYVGPERRTRIVLEDCPVKVVGTEPAV